MYNKKNGSGKVCLVDFITRYPTNNLLGIKLKLQRQRGE